MTLTGTWLGIDFGTSNTVAFLRRDDGTVTPLLFDASPLLASGVFSAADGPVLTGADATRAAAANPAGFEPNPKQRIDDATTWLGGRDIAVHELIAAVLRRVADEAHRVAGADPTGVVLTYPAGWSRTRLAVLAAAAEAAGLAGVGFVREPVAAAAYFAGALGHDLGSRQCLLVYDFGAGTFDVTVVRRADGGMEVLATDGLTDVGGNDLDAVVVDHLRSLSPDPAAWGRLDWPETAADQRARRGLWADARAAKEQLTRHTRAEVHVPIADVTLHITREEFDAAARRHLERTVTLTVATLRAAGVSRETVGGLLLVGGSSRIPLVATLLHRTLGLAPTVMEQPELVVAHGSLYLADQDGGLERPPALPSAPPGAAGTSEEPAAVVPAASLPEAFVQEAPVAAPVPVAVPAAEPAPVAPSAPPEADPPADPPAEPEAAPVAPRAAAPAGGSRPAEPVTEPRRRRTIAAAAAVLVVALAVALLVNRPWDNTTGQNPGGGSSPTAGAALPPLDSIRRSTPGCQESDARVVWTPVRSELSCPATATKLTKRVGWDTAFTQSYAELRMSLSGQQFPSAFKVSFTIDNLSAPEISTNRGGCGGLAVHSTPDGRTYDYFNVCADGWIEIVSVVNDTGGNNRTGKVDYGPTIQGTSPTYTVLVDVTASAVQVTVSNAVGGSQTVTSTTTATTTAYLSLMTTWRNIGATAAFSDFTYTPTR